MIVFRFAWVIAIGIPVALILFTLGVLACVTIIGIPFGLVLLVLGGKALSAPF